jgi:hypothetical protein
MFETNHAEEVPIGQEIHPDLRFPFSKYQPAHCPLISA